MLTLRIIATRVIALMTEPLLTARQACWSKAASTTPSAHVRCG